MCKLNDIQTLPSLSFDTNFEQFYFNKDQLVADDEVDNKVDLSRVKSYKKPLSYFRWNKFYLQFVLQEFRTWFNLHRWLERVLCVTIHSESLWRYIMFAFLMAMFVAKRSWNQMKYMVCHVILVLADLPLSSAQIPARLCGRNGGNKNNLMI